MATALFVLMIGLAGCQSAQSGKPPVIAGKPVAAGTQPTGSSQSTPADNATGDLRLDYPVTEETLFITAPSGLQEMAADKPTRPSSSARFLTARQASYMRDIGAAADFYTDALHGHPDHANLLRQAFLAQYQHGDLEAANRLFIRLDQAGSSVILGSEPAAILAASQSDWRGLEVVANHLLADETSSHLGSLLKAWAIAMQGRRDAALAALGEADSQSGKHRLHQQALLLEAMGDHAGAVSAARRVVAEDEQDPAYQLPMIALLQRLGETRIASAAFDRLDLTVFNPGLLRQQMRQGKGFVTRPSVRAALATAILQDHLRVRPVSRATALFARLRLVLHLNPADGHGLFQLALVMRRLGRDAEAAALLASVNSENPWHYPARLQLARLQRVQLDDAAAARKTLDSLQENAVPTARLWQEIAFLEQQQGDYAAALNALDNAVGKIGQTSQLLFYRGIYLDRLDRDREAEQAFRQSLSVSPDDAYTLNYLGYWLIDRGEKLEEALALIRKAVSIQPENSYFMDSLGWAHYRLGNYDKAVTLLEDAVSRKADDRLITDHLGDAYWRAGRQREARYQWQRARSLARNRNEDDPSDAELQRKLRDGLDPLPAPAGTATAKQ